MSRDDPLTTPRSDVVQLWGELWADDSAPTLAAFLTRWPRVTTAQLVQLVAIDQAERWRRGEHLFAEDYLRRHAALREDVEARLDVIYGEFLLRQQEGEAPRSGDFERRFPHLADRLRRLLTLDEMFADEPAQPGQQARWIGPYRVIRRHAGGDTRVYRVVHPTSGQDVLLHQARKAVSASEGDALRAEGHALAKLDHPTPGRVYDLDVHEGRPYLVAEYVRGRSLEQVIGDRSLSPRACAALVAQLARAVAAVHAVGQVHLRIRPSAVRLDDTGQPRLLELGVARLLGVRGGREQDVRGLRDVLGALLVERSPRRLRAIQRAADGVEALAAALEAYGRWGGFWWVGSLFASGRRAQRS